jgi:hypothetical protein
VNSGLVWIASCFSYFLASNQVLDVYKDAQAHNVTVVGGSARTVGAAGGYLTGGGHSPFAHFYGLAADSE